MPRGKPQPNPDTEEITRTILGHVCAPDYTPVKKTELLRHVGIEPADRQAAEKVLDRLLFDGILVSLKHKGIALADSVDLVKGTISFIRSGAAYINSPDGKKEVFVPPSATGTALHGDQVLARFVRKRFQGRKVLEGQVIRVLERSTRTVVGTLAKSHVAWYVKPMQSRLKHEIIVPGPGDAKIGDRVLVQLADWIDEKLSPEGEIVEVIGPEDNPTLDTIAAMKQYELPTSFPADVTTAAETLTITEDAYVGRLDLRDTFTFTIDPKTARDFDDAITLERKDDGNWLLGVHIADVSHFVTPGSRLDKEAFERGTSVYFPDRVVPMLPPQLSNGICSLRPNVDRLTFSGMITLNDAGDVLHSEFRECVIHSKLRLTYHQAWAALTSAKGASFPEWKMDPETVDRLKICNELAQKIRAKRMEVGSLQLDLPGVEFDIGKDGRINGVIAVDNDASHQLIEEFMLLANECVCKTLAKADRQQVFRIHEEPDPEKLADLTEMFIANGANPGNLTDRKQLAAFLKSISGAPQAHTWYTKILRSLKRAQYSAQNIGHYGLAKEFYTHFTSPIRRYPDLLIHRLTKALIKNQPSPYSKQEVAAIAEQATAREEVADEASRLVIELKKMRYFQEQLASGNMVEYDAIVTEIRNFGMLIDIPSVMTFGLVPLSLLDFDFFDFDRDLEELHGRRTGVVYKASSRIKVIIARINEERKQLDFMISDVATTVRRAPGKKGNKSDSSRGKKGKRSRSPRTKVKGRRSDSSRSKGKGRRSDSSRGEKGEGSDSSGGKDEKSHPMAGKGNKGKKGRSKPRKHGKNKKR